MAHQHRQSQSKKSRTISGVITWKYKALRVHTPDDITREVWEKLKAYVDILEPPK